MIQCCNCQEWFHLKCDRSISRKNCKKPALQKLFIGACNFVHTISVLCITFYMLVLQKMHGIVQILKMIQLGFTYSITSLNS